MVPYCSDIILEVVKLSYHIIVPNFTMDSGTEYMLNGEYVIKSYNLWSVKVFVMNLGIDLWEEHRIYIDWRQM